MILSYFIIGLIFIFRFFYVLEMIYKKARAQYESFFKYWTIYIESSPLLLFGKLL